MAESGSTAQAEALTEFLGVVRIAVEVHRDEQPRALDEFARPEDRRLDLVTGRAPGRAPVQEYGLVVGAGELEGLLDAAIEPGNLL